MRSVHSGAKEWSAWCIMPLALAATRVPPKNSEDSHEDAPAPATAERDGEKSGRRQRPLSEFQRRLEEYKEKKRLEEAEKVRLEIERLKREHAFNFERFVDLKKSYEVETDSVNRKLNMTVVRCAEDLYKLGREEAFKPMTLAELRGYEFAMKNGDTGAVNGAMRIYQKSAAQIFKVKESEVTGDMLGMIGSYMHAKRKADDEIQQEKYNDAYQLKEWPGIGFDGFTRRKQEELWSLYGTDGRVIREKLQNDCGVIHFAGVGEVVVHKSAIPLTKQLLNAWATERWQHLAPLDARQAVADIRRTQGTGAIMQILNMIERIVNIKMEATASADSEHDYAFRLPYVDPHIGGHAWDVDMAKLRAEHAHRFILSYPAALNHNNILPPYRLRYNLTKTTFLHKFLLELSMNNRISFKSIREIEDP